MNLFEKLEAVVPFGAARMPLPQIPPGAAASLFRFRGSFRGIRIRHFPEKARSAVPVRPGH